MSVYLIKMSHETWQGYEDYRPDLLYFWPFCGTMLNLMYMHARFKFVWVNKVTREDGFD